MILYFSGTGNTRLAADRLARLTGDQAVPIDFDAASMPLQGRRDRIDCVGDSLHGRRHGGDRVSAPAVSPNGKTELFGISYEACGQGQVGVEVAGAAGVFHFSYYYYSGFVGRQQEAVDASPQPPLPARHTPRRETRHNRRLGLHHR